LTVMTEMESEIKMGNRDSDNIMHISLYLLRRE